MSAPPEHPQSPTEPELLFCHECRMAVELHELPPVPLDAPPRPCPFCSRGFLEEDPPPPLYPPPPRACVRCGGPTTPPESPPPPPPPPFYGSSSSDLSDDPDSDFDLFRHFATSGRPLAADFAAAAEAAEAVFRASNPRHAATEAAAAFDTVLHRPLGIPLGPNLAAIRAAGGEPPAPAASIAALPTVEVAELATACAICKDDLPLASQALRLPCAHLYHSSCIVTWLELHNSCPVCRSSIPSPAVAAAATPSAFLFLPPAEPEDSLATEITIRFTTTTTRRRSGRVHGDAAAVAAAPVSASPTQLAQAVTGDGPGGPANSGETVSSEWPRHPESDAAMSEAREEDAFSDWTLT